MRKWVWAARPAEPVLPRRRDRWCASPCRLKHHEAKLLRKVDFLTWSHEDNLREISVMRRYHIAKRDDYIK